MTRTKLGLLGLCAVVLGMMAMSASSAQASLFKWLILDSSKKVSTELKALVAGELDTKEASLVTKLLGKKFWVTCTNFKLEGVNLEVLGTLTEGGRVVFTGCEVYGKGPLEEPLGCGVHTLGQPAGTVRSNEGKGSLLLHTFKDPDGKELSELVTRITPKTGENFATLLTEECVFPESNPVQGKLVIEDCLLEAEIHKEKHLIIQNEALTELWVGSKTAEHLETDIIGSAWVFLAGPHSGLEWAGIHNLP